MRNSIVRSMGHGTEACEHTTGRGGDSRFRGGGAWMCSGLPRAWGWWEDPMQKTPGRWPPQHGKHWARRFPEAARRQTGRWLGDKALRHRVISTRQWENTTVHHVSCRHCQLILKLQSIHSRLIFSIYFCGSKDLWPGWWDPVMIRKTLTHRNTCIHAGHWNFS